MSDSSILGGTPAAQPSPGKDVDLLGPSDSSDSGSDVQGERASPIAPDSPDQWGSVVPDMDSSTDAGGTGERASADGDAAREGADILPDRIIDDTGADDDASERGESIGAAGLSTDDDDEAEIDDEEIEDAR